jgi:hypothetical protein
MITCLDILQELDDDTVKEVCHAIKKPSGGTLGYQVSKLVVIHFKLFTFWVRHMWCTSREVEDWSKMRYDDVKLLMNHKTMEDGYSKARTLRPLL